MSAAPRLNRWDFVLEYLEETDKHAPMEQLAQMSEDDVLEMVRDALAAYRDTQKET